MKNTKKIGLLLLTIVLLFISSKDVYAGSCTIGFDGNSTANVGDTITVNMYVSNVSGATNGVVSVGGNLTFDKSYLQYVSGTGATSPYTFQINEASSYKVAGLDTSLSNGITSRSNVFTFKFKVLKEGKTTVSFSNYKTTDSTSVLTTNVSGKTITIGNSSSGGDDKKSSDATLKSLSVKNYNLSPSFSANTTSYTVKVGSDVNSVNISALTNDAAARVSGAGNITLSGKETTATITVTAEDGTKKNYTIKIQKDGNSGGNGGEDKPNPSANKSSDASLKSLDVSGYTLNPGFKSGVLSYTIKVGSNISGLNVNAIANSDKARVEVSGNNGFKEGVNTINIKVTAEDGTVKVYSVNVIKDGASSNKPSGGSTGKDSDSKKSNDATLSSLTINSPHTIDKEFNKSVTSYSITVPNEVTKLDFNYAKSNSKARVEVSGNEDFKVGEVNNVVIKVTAEDGSVNYYLLNVTRSDKKSEADLKELVIDGGDMDPKFDKDVLNYTVKVDKDTDKLDIKALAENSDAKVEIIGNENLKEGHNTVFIKVTDKNGITKIYELDVIKDGKKSGGTFLGLKPSTWGIILGIGGFLFLLWLLLLLLKRRKKDDKKVAPVVAPKSPDPVPVIEFKPEFNFGSKNNSDDDVVYGNMNQDSEIEYKNYDDEDTKQNVLEASYEEVDDDTLLEDATVTKKEIIDAINEATKSKDVSRLEQLLKQDAINQKKKELKNREKRY